MTVQLLHVSESHDVNDKRYTAYFDVDGSLKIVRFGDKYKKANYTIHQDENRKRSYLLRHRKDLKTGDPTRRGFLSLFLLWNKKTLLESIADYNRRLADNNWSV
jgi:hypothetical protein